jgi:large subunit ribosomal protein L24e
MNKKIKTDELLRKKKRRNVKINKAIVGISLEDLKKKKNEKPEVRKAIQEQALRDIKERK